MTDYQSLTNKHAYHQNQFRQWVEFGGICDMKTEMDVSCLLTKQQIYLYEQALDKVVTEVSEAGSELRAQKINEVEGY